MSQSTIANHIIPARVITHTVATIRGQQLADLSVYHARTPDARIALTWSGVLMQTWSCQAAQGLLEAFSAARAAMARVPLEIPPPAKSRLTVRPDHHGRRMDEAPDIRGRAAIRTE